MSADNGYVLRRNQDNKYVLQMYFASADEYPKIVTGPANGSYIFDSLQDALLCYEMNCESEYGLTVHIKEVTYDHQHRMESWGNFGQRCAVTNCTFTKVGPIDSLNVGRSFDA